MANSDEITPLAGVSSKPKVEIKTSRNRNIEDLKSGEPLFSQGKKNVIQEESSSDEYETNFKVNKKTQPYWKNIHRNNIILHFELETLSETLGHKSTRKKEF